MGCWIWPLSSASRTEARGSPLGLCRDDGGRFGRRLPAIRFLQAAEARGIGFGHTRPLTGAEPRLEAVLTRAASFRPRRPVASSGRPRFFLAGSSLDQSVIQFFDNHSATLSRAPDRCVQKPDQALGVPIVHPDDKGLFHRKTHVNAVFTDFSRDFFLIRCNAVRFEES